MYEGTNVRSGPSTSSAIVKRTGKGESYPIVSTKGDWYEIKLSNGDSAYVASWVVQTVDQISAILAFIKSTFGCPTVESKAGS